MSLHDLSNLSCLPTYQTMTTLLHTSQSDSYHVAPIQHTIGNPFSQSNLFYSDSLNILQIAGEIITRTLADFAHPLRFVLLTWDSCILRYTTILLFMFLPELMCQHYACCDHNICEHWEEVNMAPGTNCNLWFGD